MSDLFAFCSVSISPLRAEPKDSSEMVSQLLFGETIIILEQDKQWRKVKTLSDSYEGWLDEKCISYLTELEKRDWESSRVLLFNSTSVLESSEGAIFVTRGAFIGPEKGTFPIGKFNYSIKTDLEICPSEIASIAKSYLNAPYLWGGKTIFGIDCSGFTQMVYRFCGISLGRDASIQVNEGKSISYEDKREGDLAFFKNSAGKIHHVGIILNNDKIIHAHGWLRIDELDIQGIKHRNKVDYSHLLVSIKRHI